MQIECLAKLNIKHLVYDADLRVTNADGHHCHWDTYLKWKRTLFQMKIKLFHVSSKKPLNSQRNDTCETMRCGLPSKKKWKICCICWVAQVKWLDYLGGFTWLNRAALRELNGEDRAKESKSEKVSVISATV